jgi:thiamine-phosphate diphosphorylase
MLQFLTTKSSRYSVADQATMALEAGCRWIQVDANDGDMRQTLEQLTELCKANEAILTVTDDIQLCQQLRIHGLHLTSAGISPADARQQLGADAIIGVDVTSADQIIALKGLDIDYATVVAELTVEQYRQLMETVKQAEADVHVVASKISPDDIAALRTMGVAGVAFSKEITESPDPETLIKTILSQG